MSRCTERSGLDTDIDMLEALERLLSRVVVIVKRFSGGLQHDMLIFRVIFAVLRVESRGAVEAIMGERGEKVGKARERRESAHFVRENGRVGLLPVIPTLL